ncbi:MFS transporter [Nonomuraea sp. NPDC050153]|uniref:MFS transporter n=1 Tax=Nonomuraea sp. NPDC050153 TaxID=3364359 RepID=UPI00378D25A0
MIAPEDAGGGILQGDPEPTRPDGDSAGERDFRLLWAGTTVSQLGSAVSMVALPVVAITVLDASAFQVALLSVIQAVTIVLVAFPLGRQIEFRAKRPVMIWADLARCILLFSIPVAAFFGLLTFAHLCVAALGNAAGQIAASGAAQAHLKALVPAGRLMSANSRLESTRWLSVLVGPSLAGPLIGVLSAVGALLVDAVSFVVSAWSIRSLRTPEPPPPAREPGPSRREELFAGWGFVRGHPILRRMFASWLIFAGASAMATPLSSLFYLRDLGFTPWQYGLLMGLPSLGGFLGARLAPRLSRRFGLVRGLWWVSLWRGPWYALIPLGFPGTAGLLLCGFGFAGVLFFSGLANSTMTTYRQLGTPDHLLARVSTLWIFATNVTQPVFIAVGGLVASTLGTRAGLFLVAACMFGSALLLPRRERTEDHE